MTKGKKMLIVLINIILMLYITSTIVHGNLIDTFEGSVDTSGSGATDVADKAGKIVGIIQVVGTMVSVGMLIVLGIKYMMGSAEEKAEYKKTFIPYVVGAALIFAASVFAQSIYDIFYNMTSK